MSGCAALRYDCDARRARGAGRARRGRPATRASARASTAATRIRADEALAALERTIAARAAARPAESYTAELLADPPRIGEKVREEADEVARAAADE